MFNSVQFVRDLCQKNKVSVAKLERDCGFSNGYLNPKKMSKLPYDRALAIAQYLNVPVDLILTGEENAPTETSERKFKDDEIMFALSRGGEQEITEEMFDEVRRFAEFIAHREKDREK